jgi:hypothetical protein
MKPDFTHGDAVQLAIIQGLSGERRAPGRVFGRNVFLSTPEDLILTKLVWFRQSDSQKHYLDALGVCRAQKAVLNYDYLHDQAVALSVASLLERLENEAQSA